VRHGQEECQKHPKTWSVLKAASTPYQSQTREVTYLSYSTRICSRIVRERIAWLSTAKG